jgi:hypothetical protein
MVCMCVVTAESIITRRADKSEQQESWLVSIVLCSDRRCDPNLCKRNSHKKKYVKAKEFVNNASYLPPIKLDGKCCKGVIYKVYDDRVVVVKKVSASHINDHSHQIFDKPCRLDGHRKHMSVMQMADSVHAAWCIEHSTSREDVKAKV